MMTSSTYGCSQEMAASPQRNTVPSPTQLRSSETERSQCPPRLSMEIQGVPYGNLEGAIAFLAEHGLTTGETGSLVRPVVSCKGTTCQYGLIDTFSLSEI